MTNKLNEYFQKKKKKSSGSQGSEKESHNLSFFFPSQLFR